MLVAQLKKTQLAITLFEVLVAIAVLFVVAGIAYPAISGVRKAGLRTTTISNLRQCGSALLIYAVDWGDVPNYGAARSILDGAPTCDAMDYWRLGCDVSTSDPLIGSYAYIRLVKGAIGEQQWRSYRERVANPPLLASIWHSQYEVAKILGDGPPRVSQCRQHLAACTMPSLVHYCRLDGSLMSIRSRVPPPWSSMRNTPWHGQLFTWSNVFDFERFEGR